MAASKLSTAGMETAGLAWGDSEEYLLGLLQGQ